MVARSNHKSLNDGFIKALEVNNGALKSLTLENLSNLTAFKGSFPELVSLILKNCPNLKSIDITSPHLQKLIAPNCPVLADVKVSHPTLRILDLSVNWFENIALTDEVLDGKNGTGGLLKSQPNLKKLNVEGCSNISFPDVRSANHKYPVELLKEIVDKSHARSIARLLNKKSSELILEYYKIKAEGAKALGEGLKTNKVLTSLDLRSNKIGAEGGKAIGEGLKTNTALTSLNLYKNNIGDEGAKALGEALASNTTLTKLSLYDNKIGAEGAKAIGHGLKFNETLTSLDLRSNSIGDEGAKALGEGLKTNKAVTSLDLSSHSIGDEGAKALGEVLKANTTLTSLDLCGNKIGDEGAKALGEGLKTNKALTSLGLSWNEVGDEGAKAIGEALKTNITLTSLNLCRNEIGDEGGKAIGEGLVSNTTLTTLYLSRNSIGDEGAKALGEGLKTNKALTSLGLSWNEVGDEGGKAIGEALVSNTTLIQLNLNVNSIGAEGAQSIGQGLVSNTTLTTLYLSRNSIGDEGAQSIGEALASSTTLTTLHLGSNHIRDEGAKAIIEGLTSNTTLTDLDLESTLFRDEGTKAIIEELRTNTTLTRLNLASTDIANEEAKSIGEALKTNITLTSLSLYRNEIGDEGAKALGEGLKTNKALTSLDLRNNKIGAEGAKAIGEGLASNTALTQLDLYSSEIGAENERIISEFLRRNQGLAESSTKLTDGQSEKALILKPILLKGTSSQASFTFASNPMATSNDLLDILNIDRGHGVQQLLAVKDQKIFCAALAPDIQIGCMKQLMPLSFQDHGLQLFYQEMMTGKQPGFEERLKIYAENPETYRRYVRFVLGTDTPLQHTLQNHSLKTLAKLLGFSYVIWQKPSPDSLQLKEVECVLNAPPVQHVLYSPPLSGELYGRYELLKEENSSGTYVFREGNKKNSDNFDDETQISFPWLKPVEELLVPNMTPLFALSSLQSLSPPFRSLLEPLKTSNRDLVAPPSRLNHQETVHLARLLMDNTTLTKIVLPSCQMRDEGAKAWANLIKQNKSLTFLSLPNNQIGIEGIEALKQALQENKTLLDLRLTGNPSLTNDPSLGARKAKEIQNLLKRNQALQYARYIRQQELPEVYTFELGAPGTRLLIQEITGCSFLKTVSFNCIPFYEPSSLDVLKNFLGQTPSLESLTLLDAELSDASLEALMSSFVSHPSLRFLDLRGNKFREGTVKEFVNCLSNNSKLCQLDVGWNPLKSLEFRPLIEAWKTKPFLKVLKFDLHSEEDLKKDVSRLEQEKQGGRGFPLEIPGTIHQKTTTDYEITLRGTTQLLKRVNVSLDGNCGYSSMQITRDQAAEKLVQNLSDPLVQRMLALEIWDNFVLGLPPKLKTQTYRDLQNRSAAIDEEKRQKMNSLKDALVRENYPALPAGEAWTQERLLKEYFTPQVTLKQSIVTLMQSLIELTLKEERFEQDKYKFCSHPDTLNLYIEHFIRPLSAQYFDEHHESNWLNYSPQLEHGYYRFSSADALAYVFGKNLAIWAESWNQGNPTLILAHEHHWKPGVETMHLLNNGAHSSANKQNFHFDRLEVMD